MGGFGCLYSPVCDADWSAVRSVGVNPVRKDVRIEYIVDGFSQCKSSDAAPLTELRDLYTLLHIYRDCATGLYLIWTLCVMVRISICVEEVIRRGGDLSVCRTMNGAALANDRSGVTFTAELCMELLRKSAKKEYSQTRPMPCRFCGKVICVDMYRHVARLHLDLVQLWRCPIAWCTRWKGSPQDCLEHVRSGHDALWVSKTASIEKYAPPWTVCRQLWTDSLRIEHSGISTDMLLFSEVGMPLTQHYRVYKGGCPVRVQSASDPSFRPRKVPILHQRPEVC